MNDIDILKKILDKTEGSKNLNTATSEDIQKELDIDNLSEEQLIKLKEKLNALS